MDKIYSVTVWDGPTPIIVFSATLDKARLRSHIHRLQGYRCTRPALFPKLCKAVASAKSRNQIVSPALWNGEQSA